jgi:hypothetical protein
VFHRRVRPAPRISIRDEKPEEELARLRRMLDDLNAVIEMLWMEVEGLRAELARVRGSTDVPGMYAKPPTQLPHAGPSTRPVEAQLVALRGAVDAANVAADALWFETQWMRSQLAAAIERPL